VANNPKDFAGAYWAINSLQVFQDHGQGGTNTTSSLASSDGGGIGKMVRRSQAVGSASRSGKEVLPIYL
jgi:hypothetical protein